MSIELIIAIFIAILIVGIILLAIGYFMEEPIALIIGFICVGIFLLFILSILLGFIEYSLTVFQEWLKQTTG
ncbi:MAG: hypothetical protein KKG75_00165 [Nanoarchaeota archaeon]|nr:hypothetical protein [Nanoarchaeota archaeon]